jgi:deoxyribonuclease V
LTIEKIDVYSEFYDLLAQIPEGFVSTYGDLAIQLGDIVASRAVGEMLSENKDPVRFPCHRVVMSDGTLGGFTHPLGVKEKVDRLKRDGVIVVNGRIENFEKIRFREFRSKFPLKRFRNSIKGIRFRDSDDFPTEMRAMDISYSGRKGIGVAVDFGKELSFEIVVREVKSPYIPNYLYLREGEIYEEIVEKNRMNIIDGNGILHREMKGVATIVGANRNVSTVGIAKSLLTGEVKGEKVFVDGLAVGVKCGKYYISPGYRTNVRGSFNILKNSRYFPHTKYPDRISRRYRDEVLPHQYSI